MLSLALSCTESSSTCSRSAAFWRPPLRNGYSPASAGSFICTTSYGSTGAHGGDLRLSFAEWLEHFQCQPRFLLVDAAHCKADMHQRPVADTTRDRVGRIHDA